MSRQRFKSDSRDLNTSLQTMPSRKKKSAAWKKLRSAALKGPKRIRTARRRRSGDKDPLTDPGTRRNVSVTIDSGYAAGTLVVTMFVDAFEQLRLKKGKKYSMAHDHLTRAGRCLKPLFKAASHNDYILRRFQERKLSNCVGRCLVQYGIAVGDTDASIHITYSEQEKKRREQIDKHVQTLFSRYS